VCQINQLYSWNGVGDIDFGSFEGAVYVYQPGGSARMLNFSDRSAVNREQIVFG